MAPSSPPTQEPALATTKRKFDTLLDRLQNASASTTSLANSLRESNGSTTSLAQPSTPEPTSKRYRPSDTGMNTSRQVSGSERIQQLKSQLLTPRKEGGDKAGSPSPGGLRVVGQHQTSVNSTTPRKPANYQPYSQEQFLGRLKTFADVKKWTNKPDALGDVEWAKRGWSCESWNTVACKGGCEKRLVVRLRSKRKDKDGKELDMSEDLTVEVDSALVEKYQELIVDAHHEDCLWRKRGCQDDIYHIPIPNRTQSTADLLTRYQSFRSIVNDLPILENLIYPGPRIQDILKHLPASFFTGSSIAESPPSSPTDSVSFLFAVFGWKGVSETKISMAVCGHCHQRVGLWLVKDDRLKEMSKKLDVPIETLRLNLVESHREHCPWKNPETQHNPADGPIANMAGWQTQEFMLLGTRREKRAQETAHAKNVESVDLGSEYTYPRGSTDSDLRSPTKEDKDEDLGSKWKKLKAKLKRTASKKSLRSTKSVKSTKSARSVAEQD